MDYEKKYKEAQGWIEKIYPTLQHEQQMEAEAFFPELKESEDEKIRKAIHIYLDWLDGRKDCQPKGDYTIKDMIAWLEKQKEFVSADFDDVWETADCEELIATLDKYSKDAIKEMCHAWYDKGIELERRNWLEKQGEQKPFDYENANIAQKDFAPKVEPKFKVKYAGSEYNILEVKDIAGVAFYGIEDEPNHIDYVKAENCEIISGYGIKENGSPYPTKPADKVEPKFQNGQWIVWQNKCYKVNYNGCGYELVDQNGLSTSLEYGTVDESAHLWTIEDAKDGDVLVCKGDIKYSNGIKYEKICLFNNLDNAFFTLTKTSNYKEEYDIDVNIDYPDNIVPATKEQKEILFMAMKEAGYEWSDKDRKLSHSKVTKISDQVQKPAWSEEDQKIWSEISDMLWEGYKQSGSKFSWDEIRDWIKPKVGFFKYRIQPQPKQEWSEKDEVKINRIVACLENLNVADNDILLKDVDWLKSLRPQNRWKPSDEQMAILYKYAEQNNYDGSILTSLYNDLKKLKLREE